MKAAGKGVKSESAALQDSQPLTRSAAGHRRSYEEDGEERTGLSGRPRQYFTYNKTGRRDRGRGTQGKLLLLLRGRGRSRSLCNVEPRKALRGKTNAQKDKTASILSTESRRCGRQGSLGVTSARYVGTSDSSGGRQSWDAGQKWRCGRVGAGTQWAGRWYLMVVPGGGTKQESVYAAARTVPSSASAVTAPAGTHPVRPFRHFATTAGTRLYRR